MSATSTTTLRYGLFDPVAMLARAEQVIDVMNKCYIEENWSPPDREDTERFLQYFRNVAGKPDWDDADDLMFVAPFCQHYNQSLDWIFRGDARVMICNILGRRLSARRVCEASPES
jgi:hypothetical protein